MLKEGFSDVALLTNTISYACTKMQMHNWLCVVYRVKKKRMDKGYGDGGCMDIEKCLQGSRRQAAGTNVARPVPYRAPVPVVLVVSGLTRLPARISLSLPLRLRHNADSPKASASHLPQSLRVFSQHSSIHILNFILIVRSTTFPFCCSQIDAFLGQKASVNGHDDDGLW